MNNRIQESEITYTIYLLSQGNPSKDFLTVSSSPCSKLSLSLSPSIIQIDASHIEINDSALALALAPRENLQVLTYALIYYS